MPTHANPTKQSALSRQQVLADVKQILSEHATIPPDDIQETHALLTDLGCDSLDVIEIAMEVEEHFDISVPDDQEEDLRTVADVADNVLRLLVQGRNN